MSAKTILEPAAVALDCRSVGIDHYLTMFATHGFCAHPEYHLPPPLILQLPNDIRDAADDVNLVRVCVIGRYTIVIR